MTRNHGSSFRHSGPYTSPGTPEHGGDIPKTWSSERVPLPTSSSSRRHISAAALMPFNSGRALPSKWDDAERWITSPVSGYGAFKNSIANQEPHHRRPKSKSGPLGPTGPDEGGGSLRSSFMGSSPLMTGVLVPDGCLSVSYGSGIGVKSSSLFIGNNNNYNNINNMTRSTSVPGLSDLVSESSVPSSKDDNKLDGTKYEEEEEEEDHVSHRDVATQMSPQGSTNSSSRGRLSFSNLASSVSKTERLRENHATRDDVRDVQVDKGTTTAKQSKKLGLTKMGSTDTDDLGSPSWNVGEASKNISKFRREEAKITAWENLQKAKAEAAIRKLEMKLEKRRSGSMDRITNKLRAAQMKAQTMRDLLSDQAPRNSHKGFSFCIYVRICNCFVCDKS